MDLYDNIKAQKAKAMSNYQRQLKLKNFLFLLQICLVLAFLPSLYNWIPIAMKLTSEYMLTRFIGIFRSTFYVFLLTNVMIFALAMSFYLKSEPKTDIQDEYRSAVNSGRELTVADESPAPQTKPEKPSSAFDDKEIIYSENGDSVTVASVEESSKHEIVDVPMVQSNTRASDTKILRRSETDLCRKMVVEKPKRELRRSETENKRTTTTTTLLVEDMSNEEFRNTIDRFIATQKKIRSEEFKNETLVFTQKTQPSMAMVH